eukprot:897449-Prymnesium_polylepis.1
MVMLDGGQPAARPIDRGTTQVSKSNGARGCPLQHARELIIHKDSQIRLRRPLRVPRGFGPALGGG